MFYIWSMKKKKKQVFTCLHIYIFHNLIRRYEAYQLQMPYLPMEIFTPSPL